MRQKRSFHVLLINKTRFNSKLYASFAYILFYISFYTIPPWNDASIECFDDVDDNDKNDNENDVGDNKMLILFNCLN